MKLRVKGSVLKYENTSTLGIKKDQREKRFELEREGDEKRGKKEKHGIFWMVRVWRLDNHLGRVCFQENTFLETIFLTFPCLINTWKVSQRKLNSGQKKS